MSIETPDDVGAFPRLSQAQVATLAAGGTRRAMTAGAILIRAGAPSDEFFVILSGTVSILDDADGAEHRVLRIHGPGRFLGELGLLEGQVAFYTARMAEDGEVLAVPIDRIRALVEHDPMLSDLILRAYLIRRCRLLDMVSGFRIIGSCYSPDTRRLREFAVRNRLPHNWIDLERDARAERLLRELGVAPDETPVVIWRGERVLRNPTNAELARLLGLPVLRTPREVCDLVVVGAGPAGLAASVYGASDGLDTSVLEAIAAGGQAGTSSCIENYLGFPAGVSGTELAERAIIQAGKFGARLLISAEVAGLEAEDGHHLLRLAGGGAVLGRTVVLATGARYRRLAVPGIERFEGTGVYYAATHQEASMCGVDPVAIVGGGNSAGQATVFLAGRVEHVHLLIRGGDLGKSMSRYLVDRIEQHPRVTVHRDTEVREVIGAGEVDAIVVENNRTAQRATLAVRALFVFIGATPCTAWLADAVALDSHGFVRTGSDAVYPVADQHDSHRRPLPLETSRAGIFAVGDVRSGSVKRVASAVGEGAMAVRHIHEYLERS
ncbi:FAD-dependent oxidoreductase [Nocardia sp. NPDC056000]|uniref:FAD-dependent oxidoreductase n=1 Tax=Nocardia sp. NPDC056000 TaxID=3345674 RepID=UPI0035DB0E19